MTLTLRKANAPEAQASPHETGSPDPLIALPEVATLPVPHLMSQRVLLVEDDELVADAMCQLLRSWGMKVRHVETADHALRESDYGEIAICDVRLPHGASGLDVALALREAGKKVLLISGETNAALRDTAQRHRLELLTKPVAGTALLAALKAL